MIYFIKVIYIFCIIYSCAKGIAAIEADMLEGFMWFFMAGICCHHVIHRH